MLRTILLVLCAAAPLAAADPAPTPTVIHVPPGFAIAGRPLELAAMIDTPLAEALVVYWRPAGGPAWSEQMFERSSAGGWYARLPVVVAPGVEYYVAGRDAAGAQHPHFASAAAPHLVRAEPTVADRLEQLDDRRLDGTRDRIAIDVDGHNFGNRHGVLDRFIRSEASFTHRVGQTLYEIQFGFGLIQGATPVESVAGGDHVIHGARYGFSGLRVRLGHAVFVDGRISLGVSHDGFAPGGGGAVTFGRPWRSNVSVGGEIAPDLGPSVFVRLQWDTADPLLMAASVVRTDLPGALISEGGVYLKYEAIFRPVTRLALRGSISFGGRDGAAHFGGGLGAGLDF